MIDRKLLLSHVQKQVNIVDDGLTVPENVRPPTLLLGQRAFEIVLIESNRRNIELIKPAECKRRWATEGWDALRRKALRDWLLDHLGALAQEQLLEAPGHARRAQGTVRLVPGDQPRR